MAWHGIMYEMFLILRLYSAFTDKVQLGCHFPTPGRNCFYAGKLLLMVFTERYTIRIGKTL
jgi:hypothetical protein